MAGTIDLRAVAAARAEAPFRPSSPPHARRHVEKLWPGTPTEIIDPLAIIWDEVLHEVIGAMMRLANDAAPLHVNIREEMILELAKIQLYVGEQIVHKRLAERDPAAVDPAQERIACFGDAGWASINDTAREFYNHHWRERLETRWIPKSAAAAARERNPKPRHLAVKRVDKNHFISRWFIRDLWATDGKIMRWRRTEEGWTSARRGFGKWGYRHKLYSDGLEAYFAMIEGDAKKPIENLMRMTPLNQPESISLVAFLVIQVLRSPFFIDRIKSQLAPKIVEFGYGDDPDMANKAYETLFQNDTFYNALANPVLWSRWALVHSTRPIFVLPDTFGARREIGDGLRLIAPLSPSLCFVTLPGSETGKRIVPLHHTTSEVLARRLSGVLVGSAVDEFVSHPDFSIEDPVPGSSVAQILADIEAEIGDKE